LKNQTPARQELLLVLKKHGRITFEKLMSYFTISEPALRKHIRYLERKNFIKKEAHKQKIGRPYYTYKLTGEGHRLFSSENDQLPVQILKDAETLYGKNVVYELLAKRMEHERVNYEKASQSERLEEKVKEIVGMQLENGYMPEIHQRKDGGIELKNYHCPIYKLASSYRQVCTNEKTMYEELFPDCSVTIQSNIVEGDHVCKWIIIPKVEAGTK
jgi:predicted ArsR family transcriptional regulator